MVNTVVIVDDVAADRFFVRRSIRKVFAKAEVVEFAYAAEALAFLKTPDRPELQIIITDINMPRMDGFEFADQYVNLYPELKGQARVFVMSSSINPGDRERALSQPGIDGFFVKPVTQDAIADLM